MQTNKGISYLYFTIFVFVFFLTDDPSSEENGECFTCKYKMDDGAYIWKDQKKRLVCGLDFTFRQKREF